MKPVYGIRDGYKSVFPKTVTLAATRPECVANFRDETESVIHEGHPPEHFFII